MFRTTSDVLLQIVKWDWIQDRELCNYVSYWSNSGGQIEQIFREINICKYPLHIFTMKRCLLHFTKYLHFQMVGKMMLKIHSVPISCSSSFRRRSGRWGVRAKRAVLLLHPPNHPTPVNPTNSTSSCYRPVLVVTRSSSHCWLTISNKRQPSEVEKPFALFPTIFHL